LEDGSGKLEVGSGKWEVGSGKWEASFDRALLAEVQHVRLIFYKKPLLVE